MNEPRIFLCYASEDSPWVQELYHELKAAGYHSWRDKEELLPGQDWRHGIEQIISDPYTIVVACFSCASITQWDDTGIVQAEVTWALEVLEETPWGVVYLIPVLWEPCHVPDHLARVHWVNLFKRGGFESLKQALDSEIAKRSEGQKRFLDVQKELQYILSEYFCPYCGAMLVARVIQFVYGITEREDAEVLVRRYECGHETENASPFSF